MPVQLNNLHDAFEFVSLGQPFEHEAFLCVETGEIYCRSDSMDIEESPLPDDIEDSDKYVAIPHKHDLDLGKRLVLRFADEVLPDAADEVDDIFSRKGAYGRFKNFLADRDLLDRWYKYEEEKAIEAIRRWCKDRGIDVQG